MTYITLVSAIKIVTDHFFQEIEILLSYSVPVFGLLKGGKCLSVLVLKNVTISVKLTNPDLVCFFLFFDLALDYCVFVDFLIDLALYISCRNVVVLKDQLMCINYLYLKFSQISHSPFVFIQFLLCHEEELFFNFFLS
jgi:hypothetical protein